MTNSISDLILNNMQVAKEPSKANQYMASESDKSFDLILNNLNQASSAIEKEKLAEKSSYADKYNNQKYNTDYAGKKEEFTLKKSEDTFNDKASEKDSLKETNRYEKNEQVRKSDEEYKTAEKNEDKKTDYSKVKENSEEKISEKETNEKQVKEQANKEEKSSDSQDSTTEDPNKNNQKETSSNNQNSNEGQPNEEANIAVEVKIDENAVEEIIAIDPTTTNVAEAGKEIQENVAAQLEQVKNEVNQAISSTQNVQVATSETLAMTSQNTSETTIQNNQQTGKAAADINNRSEINNLNNQEEIHAEVAELPELGISDSENFADNSIDSTEVKVSGDLKLENTNIKTETAEKDQNPIEQSIITEMDVEVVANNTAGNNFARQQNASEQVIKLSIEPMTKSEAPDFSHLLNQTKNPIGQEKIQTNIAQTPLRELSKFDILDQISNKMPNLKSGSEKVEIILRPENLGKVNIELQSTRGLVNATLIAENKQVKELLEKNIETLRNNLTAQGVNVNNVTVKVEEPNKSAFNAFDFNQGQFGSETNKNDQGSQKASNTELYNDTNDVNISSAVEDGTASVELNNDNSLHSGTVDYKV